MSLLALFLLPSFMQPLPAVMPFADVDKREHMQTKIWELATSKLDTPEKINEYWNRYEYKAHPWGWQTPEDLLENNAGDCKDIAMAKYYTLRHKGYKAERLKLTVVLTPSAEWHMVLVLDDDLVLDNMSQEIKYLHDVNYQPAYSVNEDNLWTVTDVK